MCNVSNYSYLGNVTIHSFRTVVDANVSSKNIHMCSVAIETQYYVRFALLSGKYLPSNCSQVYKCT